MNGSTFPPNQDKISCNFSYVILTYYDGDDTGILKFSKIVILSHSRCHYKPRCVMALGKSQKETATGSSAVAVL